MKNRYMDARRLYLLLSFVSQLLFSLIFTVNLLYHVNTAKLNPLQLVLVGTILEAAVFMFEIPTGIVADTKSRKLSIVIGYTLMGLGFIFEGLFPYFAAIALSQILWGVGYTFTSGATQAWITDEAGEENAGEIFIKGSQYGQLGNLAAIPASVGIGLISVNLPILAGGFFMLLFSGFLFIFMPEKGFKAVEAGFKSRYASMLSTVKSASQYIKMNKTLALLLSIGIFYGLYSEGFDRLWTAHFIDNLKLSDATSLNPVLFFGVIRAAAVLLSLLSLQFISGKLSASGGVTVLKILITSAACIVLSLAGFAMARNLYIAVCLYLFICVFRSITEPLSDTWLNGLVSDSNIKATLFSVKGQVDALGQIAGGPVTGLIGNACSIRAALLASAILLSPAAVLYRLAGKKT